MAQCQPKGINDKQNAAGKPRVKKEKTFLSKVVIRRLPPTMTEEQFLDQISPVPANDYFYFVKADMSLGQHAFCRAYLNFLHAEDIFLFKDKFDGYVFLDSKGNEFPCIVEFAPFQKVPKKRTRKRDPKCGTIESDPDYLNFLESLKNTENVQLPTVETYLEEIESRDRERRANNGVLKVTTPLLEYLKQRKIEQQKIREERREERKRKELEKKRIREEERRRRKAEKESKEVAQRESQEETEDIGGGEKKEAVIQVLKNPDRVKENTQKSKSFQSRNEKDRTGKNWDAGDYEKRNKSRSEKQYHEKDRNHRERTEFKSSHYNKYQGEFKNKGVESSSLPPFKKSSVRNERKSNASSSYAKEKRDETSPGVMDASDKEDDSNVDSKKVHQDQSNDSKNESFSKDGKDSSKDPRTERRIRNKDRPTMEIYRPGMRRFSAQRNCPQKEVSNSSNSTSPSPSPTPTNPTAVATKVSSDKKNKTMPLSNEASTENDE